MARYEHLPIFKKVMELSVYTEETVRKFSRCQKYGIGGDLRDLSRQIVLLIIRANSTEQKSPVLQVLVETCEQLKVMLVLAKEVKQGTGSGSGNESVLPSLRKQDFLREGESCVK